MVFFNLVLCFFILLDGMVIGALDNSLDARMALLVNYSAVLNIDFCVMKMSLVEL